MGRRFWAFYLLRERHIAEFTFFFADGFPKEGAFAVKTQASPVDAR